LREAAGAVAAAAAARSSARRRPLSFYGLLAVVLLSPLPFGAVGQWAWASLALATALILCLWSLEVWRGAPVPRLGGFGGPLGLFALVLLWAAVQAWPGLPIALHHPIWATARSVLGQPLAGSVSVNPAATLHGIVRLAAYAAILFLAFAHCRDPARARLAIIASAVAVAAYAGYGLIVFLGGSETILWFPKTAYIGDLTGTFVNRNAFAAYCGLGLLCLAALLRRGLSRRTEVGGPMRERMRRHLEFLGGHGALCLGASVAVTVALLLTHSRGGLIAATIGLLVFLGLTVASRAAPRRRAALLGSVGALAAIALLAVSGEATLSRLFDSRLESELRIAIYERTLAAITDSPWTGTGLGTFRDVFQMYRTPAMERPLFRAHNTYLENAVELGIPAAAALTAAVGWLAVACLMGALRRRRDAEFPCLAAAATALVASHALVDFSLQIPAVAALYFLILGAGCAQSRSSRTR